MIASLAVMGGLAVGSALLEKVLIVDRHEPNVLDILAPIAIALIGLKCVFNVFVEIKKL